MPNSLVHCSTRFTFASRRHFLTATLGQAPIHRVEVDVRDCGPSWRRLTSVATADISHTEYPSRTSNTRGSPQPHNQLKLARPSPGKGSLVRQKPSAVFWGVD